MTRRKQAPKDLTDIRQRGSPYQVRISGDPNEYDSATHAIALEVSVAPAA